MKTFKLTSFLFYLLAILVLTGCSTTKTSQSDNGKIDVQILQINDVYEIAPLSGGAIGGMARVAQLRKELLAKNPNTYTVLAGDFLNPSVIATLKYKNEKGKMERIRGKQMVEAMNATGVDLVVFGNHEFDLKYEDLQKRFDESQFEWLAGNVRQKKADGSIGDFAKANGKAFPKYVIQEFKDADGTLFRLGIIGVCITVNQPEYVHFEDVLATARASYNEIKDQVDAVIGLTHLSVDEDKVLAEAIPELPLIMGGHEHHHMKVPVGNSVITKADANAKTAYVHQLRFDRASGKLTVKSTLRTLDEKVSLEPETNQVVEKWMEIANQSFEAKGINPSEVIKKLDAPIDATEQVVRYRPSIISTLVVDAIGAAAPDAQGALINCGSIRIDDVLEDQITQYDIVRLLPYSGEVYEVDMTGKLLKQVVKIGRVDNLGIGGYLAMDNITYNTATNETKIGGKVVEDTKVYRIALPAFLMTGGEQNLGFLTDKTEGVKKISKPTEAATDYRRDLQLAVIDYLKKNPIPKQP